MQYTYTIEKLSAVQNFMRVRYDAERLSSIRKTFNPGQFDEAHLTSLIQALAGSVISRLASLILVPEALS